MSKKKHKNSLIDPALEKDGCGIGFVVSMKGERTHRIVEMGLEMLSYWRLT